MNGFKCRAVISVVRGVRWNNIYLAGVINSTNNHVVIFTLSLHLLFVVLGVIACYTREAAVIVFSLTLNCFRQKTFMFIRYCINKYSFRIPKLCSLNVQFALIATEVLKILFFRCLTYKSVS